MEGRIYQAIQKVMAKVGAVGKDSLNPQQRYKYRSIDAVMNALHPALVDAGVFVAPEVLETSREERTTKNGAVMIYSVAKIRYTFYCDDGSSVQAVVIGEGMDSGDKSMNKAMSAAFKYALFQTFCIPTEEMHDSEEDSPEVVNVLDKARQKTLIDMCARLGWKVEEVFKNGVENLTEDQFQQAARNLQKRIDAMEGKRQQ